MDSFEIQCFGENFMDILNHRKDEKGGPQAN